MMIKLNNFEEVFTRDICINVSSGKNVGIFIFPTTTNHRIDIDLKILHSIAVNRWKMPYLWPLETCKVNSIIIFSGICISIIIAFSWKIHNDAKQIKRNRNEIHMRI